MTTSRIEDIYELSPMQQGMLFHSLYTPGSGVYCEQLSCVLEGDLDTSAFERAWARTIERHAALRTAFHWQELEKPLQVVYRGVTAPWKREDWRGLAAAEQEARAESFLKEDRRRGFELGQPPLLRFGLFRLGERKHRFVFSFHHLLMDGWCLPPLFREVWQRYLGYRRGEEVRLGPPRLYRDYIVWLQGQDMASAERFWRSHLAGFTAPTPLPGDRGPSPEPMSVQQEEALSEEATTALQGLARGGQLTLNTLVQGAWALLLARLSGEREVVFGAVVSGRPPGLPDVESIIGLFINTLPVRVDTDPGAPVIAWLRDLQDHHAEARQFEHVPLAEVQGWSEIPRGTPLFQSLVVFESYPVNGTVHAGTGNLEVRQGRMVELTNYPLNLLVLPQRRLTLRLSYDPVRFSSVSAARLLGYLRTFLEALPACAGGHLRDLPLLTPGERHQVIAEWNDTSTAYPLYVGLHELVEIQVRRTPEAVAVVYGETSLTYRELDRRASRLASRLSSLGCAMDVPVGVLMERSVEMVVALLAVVKAGGAYLPLDPEYPGERLAWMLGDANVPVLLAQERLLPALPPHGARILCLEEGWSGDPEDSEAAPGGTTSPDSLAYVLYTSGSTGRPKGVMVPHRGIVNRLLWMQQAYQLGPDDRVLQKTPFSFDVSVWEFFWPLLTGATLVVAKPGGHRDSGYLARLIERERITVLHFVPSMLQAFLAEPDLSGCGTLRLVVASGEALPSELQQRFHERLDAQLENLYGPTEASVDVTSWRCAAETVENLVPVGRPIANLRAPLLDRELLPVAIGIAGELYIAGSGLARGYLKRPDLTAERFLPNPHTETAGERLYRTGDLARYRPDGAIEFLGRIDLQVKIRGFRVELGEIEAALAACSGVREAVVVARGEGHSLHLVAYVVPEAGGDPSPAEIKETLSRRLPGHMVPSVWVPLPALPLSPNGKLDRRALPDPGEPWSPGTGLFEAPRGFLEETLAAIWSEVLGRDRIGRYESFLELGGHSLLATQCVSRIRTALDVSLSLSDFFAAPTLARLASKVDSLQGKERGFEVPPLRPRQRTGPLPLSFSQERIWFLEQLDPGTATYNMPSAVELRGELRPDALAEALSTVVRRHESLRTIFPVTGEGEPQQEIAPPGRQTLPLIDLESLPSEIRLAEAQRLAVEEAGHPFDLERGPLLRARLVRLEPERHQFLLTLHHIVSDGWSFGILVRDVSEAYLAANQGRPPRLSDLPVQYADYSLWQRDWLQGEVRESQIAFWKERLAGRRAPLELPADRPRPAVQTYSGGRVSAGLPPDLSTALRSLAGREGVTLFMILLAAFKVLLQRRTGQDDILVGSPIAGRHQIETEELIGLFLNTLALRTDLSGNPTMRELVFRVRESCLASYHHQDLPFEAVLQELQPERDLSRTPLFQILFNMLSFPRREVRLPGLTLDLVEAPGMPSKFDVTLYALTEGDSVGLDAVYNADLFDAASVSVVIEQLVGLLQQAVESPDQPVGTLSLVTARARLVLPDPALPLVSEWPGPVYQRLAGCARQDPRRVAVRDSERLVTYGDLEARSNRLARFLLASGIGAGDVVAIYAHRSAPLVEAVLGVLKARAAFAILDPAYPPARLAGSLQLAAPRAWLRMEAAGPLPDLLRDLLPSFSLSCSLELPASGEAPLDDLPAEAPEVHPEPDDLAYVAFTSGSTGAPKGIAGSHRPLSHFIAWHCATFDLGEADRFSLLSGLSHDPLLRDILTPLWAGGTLSIPDAEKLGAPGWLAGWMRTEGVTVCHLTPAVGEILTARDDPAPLETLRYAFFGGDVLTRRDVERLRLVAPRATCVNYYGATETPQAMAWRLAGEGSLRQRIPLGRGIDGVQILVLDREGRLAGIGELGEICIRTPYLSRGYVNDVAGTRERFVVNPATGAAEDRIYRTGDLGRYLTDGEVDFHGRGDLQVKVRGFRVEPMEIELALCRHPGVLQAAVRAVEDSVTGRKLAAYVVPLAAPPAPGELRVFLRESLPDYMVPASFTSLPALPLTPNGKVSYEALPDPAPAPPSEGSPGAPRSPVEELLASLWAEVLGLPQVGIHDDFFARGGHSLLATRLVSRIENAFGVELPLRWIFEQPSVSELARMIVEATAERTGQARLPIMPVSRNGELPLSFAQQRLWFLHQLHPASAVYNMPFAFRLRGTLDVPALARTLAEVVRRHETLRTTFPVRDGHPVQAIAPPVSFSVPLVDLTGVPVAARESAALELAGEERANPFDLSRTPVVRVRLIRIGEQDHALLFTIHHISGDGWSLGVLTREVVELYDAYTTEREPHPPELPVQYADFAVWQRGWLQGEALESQLAYWRRQLAGAPAALDLPCDSPRPLVPSDRGGRKSAVLPPDLSDSLAVFARRHGCTPFMTLLASFQALLHRLSGQSTILTGTPIANRNRAEIQDLIGYFVNTLALRADFEDDPTARTLLARVRETALGAYAHQDLPFERLVDELRPERDLSRAPLFQVMLVFQNTPAQTLRLRNLELVPLDEPEGMARFDLTLICSEHRSGLIANLDYAADLFAQETAARMLRSFTRILRGIVTDPEARVSDLPLLDEEEILQMISLGHGPRLELSEAISLHGLFERQAARAPEAAAVVSESEAMTYGELDRRATELARHLQGLGIGPESRVGLLLERSADAVAAMLGVLKAGGAYVPLDPEAPRERLRSIVEDAGLSILLTRERLSQVLGGFSPPLLWIETAFGGAGTTKAALAPPEPEPSAAAYVIYTSGSTGTAKGVVVPHRAAVNFTVAMARTLKLGSGDRLLLFAPLSFDASVLQLFPALASGASVAVHPNPRELAGPEILGFCERLRVTVLDLPAALWRQWVEDVAARRLALPAGLRAFLTGGESVPTARLKTWARLSDRTLSFLSSYGPTETTVTSTVFETDSRAVENLTWDPIPIGKPLPNTRAHVLDRCMRPVARGMAGDLYIGGVGLTRGYLGRPDLTAEVFLPDPLEAEPGGRLYRTGDLARHLPDGSLEFLGRADHQVKIRGFRLELGEVEATLALHPAVREAVVLLREDVSGDKRLVAYFVPTGDGESALPSVGELRGLLAERLPPYAIPAIFLPLEALPVLASGKVDRTALPAPEPGRLSLDRSYTAPRTLAEEALTEIWAQVLRVSRVGVFDNFFELGGDSILSIQIIARANQRGLYLTPRQVFEHQTIAELAAAAAEVSNVRAEQGVVSGPVLLTPIQRWFFAEGFADPHHFNHALLLETGELADPALLAQAASALFEHHDALRLRFTRTPEDWAQEIAPLETVALFTWVDLGALPASRRPVAMERVGEQLQTGFDLARGPLTRFALFASGSGRGGRLLWLAHHLVVDGVSWRVLLEDLETAYRQAAQGRRPSLPPKTTSFRTWAGRLAEHARSRALQDEISHWLQEAGASVPRLPVDFPEGFAANTVGSAETIHFGLGPEETRDLLQTVPAVYRTQVNDALLASLARAFYTWTGSSLLRVDLEGHGREPLFDEVDLSRTVGWFTSQFPVLLESGHEDDPGKALLAVKEKLRSIPGHGIGYGLLRYASSDGEVSRTLSQAARAEVSFNYLGQFDGGASEPQLFRPVPGSAGPPRSPRSHRTHLLEVGGRVVDGRLWLTLTYSRRVHHRSTLERLAQELTRTLAALIDHCRQAGEAVLTPSDFPMAKLDARTFDKLASMLDKND